AMADDDDVETCEELGDVLLQVVLNAQVAFDRKAFSIVDVINSINSKMVRRHPHVFAGGGEKISVEDVRSNWDVIKAGEKKKKPAAESYFEDVKDRIPALIQALEIGKKARKIAFDWDNPADVMEQVLSEVEELKAE